MRMVGAAATAVGINMTFLLPYSMLSKKWGKEHRGLAIFDLSTGMVIPYVLAVSCVVIASAYMFHGQPYDGLLEEKDGQVVLVESSAGINDFNKLIDRRKNTVEGIGELGSWAGGDSACCDARAQKYRKFCQVSLRTEWGCFLFQYDLWSGCTGDGPVHHFHSLPDLRLCFL